MTGQPEARDWASAVTANLSRAIVVHYGREALITRLVRLWQQRRREGPIATFVHTAFVGTVTADLWVLPAEDEPARLDQRLGVNPDAPTIPLDQAMYPGLGYAQRRISLKRPTGRGDREQTTMRYLWELDPATRLAVVVGAPGPEELIHVLPEVDAFLDGLTHCRERDQASEQLHVSRPMTAVAHHRALDDTDG